MKYLIAGGTGLIGRKLILNLIRNGNSVTVLSRSEHESVGDLLKYQKWDATSVPQMNEEFDVVINLAGAGIMDEAWTKKRKQVLYESRVGTTNTLVSYINGLEKKPQVFICASGVGYYGDKGKEEVTEESGIGDKYTSKLCEEWEGAARKANTRVVLLRTGLVLAQEGGLLPESLLSFKFGVAAYFGNGRHGWPWIHIDDEVEAIRFCAENKNIKGPVNLVSPGIVTNKEFTKAIGKIKHTIITAPVPEISLKLMFGERYYLLLISQFVKPKKLLNNGFQFKYSKLGPALKNLLLSK